MGCCVMLRKDTTINAMYGWVTVSVKAGMDVIKLRYGCGKDVYGCQVSVKGGWHKCGSEYWSRRV